jgi:hypothetical protein
MCRKSTDLSWEEAEMSTPVDGEDYSAERRELTPARQGELNWK